MIRRFEPRTVLGLMALLAVGSLIGAACGGKAVIDQEVVDDGDGGDPFTKPPSTNTTTTSNQTTTSGVGGSSGGPPIGGAPPIPPLVETDLGTVSTTQTVPFDLPPEALGMTVYGIANSQFAPIGIQTATAPDGFALVDNHVIVGTAADYDFAGIMTLGIPQTDHPQAMPPLPGTWNFKLSGAASPSLHIWYRQTLDGQFHGGVIDVNVYKVNGAASDAHITQVIQTAFNGYNGTWLGNFQVLPLSSQFATIDGMNFFDLMLETADAPGKPVLNIMLVDNIDFGGGGFGETLGFSPGAPGNPLENGTNQSGIVMTMQGDVTFDANVLRHEGGHFAGLMHTTEVEGGVGDILDDTPFCNDVIGQLFSCPDGDYLMFPVAQVGGPNLVSPKQIEVWQASAIYRGAVEAGGGVADPLDGTSNVAGAAGSQDGGDGDALSTAALANMRALSWRARHDADVLRLLEAHWCARSGIDHVSLLASLGADADALVRIGQDARVPAFMRLRALSSAGRLGPSQDVIAVLLAMAADTSLPSRVRIGAIEGAAFVAPKRLRALGLAHDAMADVADVARRR